MKRYDRLGKNLAQIGYINQPRIGPGTIGGDFRTKRIPVDSKGRQKNHPVTLSSQQFGSDTFFTLPRVATGGWTSPCPAGMMEAL